MEMLRTKTNPEIEIIPRAGRQEVSTGGDALEGCSIFSAPFCIPVPPVDRCGCVHMQPKFSSASTHGSAAGAIHATPCAPSRTCVGRARQPGKCTWRINPRARRCVELPVCVEVGGGTQHVPLPLLMCRPVPFCGAKLVQLFEIRRFSSDS